MSKRVLDIGNCDTDHEAIRDLITSTFGATVTRVNNHHEAMTAMRRETFDLVLINRKLDQDNTDGIEIIREMKADGQLSQLPVMLITNLAEHERLAVFAGAEHGFGKARLHEPGTIDVLGRFLS